MSKLVDKECPFCSKKPIKAILDFTGGIIHYKCLNPYCKELITQKDFPKKKIGIKVSFEGAQPNEIVGADIKLDPNSKLSQTGLRVDLSKSRQNNEEIHIQPIEQEENLLESVLQDFERFNHKFEKGDEDNFRISLCNFLKGAKYNVEHNYGVEGGGHVDILINDSISMQLKIVSNKTEFDSVTGQAINDLKRYQISIAVIFDITKDRKYFKKYHREEYKGILYFVFY